MKDLGPDFFTYPNLYRSMVERAADGAVFVEVGVYYGRSIDYLAQQVEQSGKQITLHCVDLWGTELEGNPFNGEEVYQQFCINLEPYIGKTLTVHRGQSSELADRFEDRSLDFVFIDADHSYDGVMKDLKAWTPKVKSGGVLAGHDFFHDPIKRALNDYFGREQVRDAGELCWIKDIT